jgi:serine/threonine protein kinase
MAEVFKAKAFGVHGYQRILALKRILPNIMEDEDFIKMFIDEARIATHLEHGNIARILELGQHGHSLYIAMEYVQGRDLRELLSRCRKRGIEFPVNLATYIISEACKGLDYAHHSTDLIGNPLEIVHRDVSPQNLLLSWDGAVKVCDFGIAKAQNRASQTQAGVLKGKFAYMSPEQVRGKPIDHRSDIFGLGVIAHEMIAGRRLFLGESDFSTLQRVRKADVRPLTIDRDDIEEQFSDAILGALKRDPKARYNNASDFADAIQPWLIEGRRITGANELKAFMHHLYAAEIAADREKMERFLALAAPPGLAEIAATETHVEEPGSEELSLSSLSVDEDKTVIFDAATMQPLEQINTDSEHTIMADPSHLGGDDDATIMADAAGLDRGYAVSAGLATLDGVATLDGITLSEDLTPQPAVPPAAPPKLPPVVPPAPPARAVPPKDRSNANRIGLGLAALVAVLVIGLGLFFVTSDGPGASSPSAEKPVSTVVKGIKKAVVASLDGGAKVAEEAKPTVKVPAEKAKVKSGTERSVAKAAKPKPAESKSKPVRKGSSAAAATEGSDCTLIVRTRPEGAMVELQGNSIGNAPVTQKGLNCSRSYRLNVSAAGYSSRSDSFEFKHNRVLVKNVRLVRPKQQKKKVVRARPSSPVSSAPPVKLMIGTPGIRAQVRVDGRAVGPTPVVARAPLLSPGPHILDLLVDGRTYSYTVVVPKATKAQRLIIRKLGQPVGGAVKASPR